MHNKTLVLGGIRSGKTALAEKAATNTGQRVVYVATATADDAEMTRRIERHKSLRPSDWGLEEEPVALGRVLKSYGSLETPPCFLIDCMSLWLTNLLMASEADWQQQRNAFLTALANYSGSVIIVSNEVGLGTIGMDSLTRWFGDELGLLNQELAQICDSVVMSVAGLPLTLKGSVLSG